MKQYLYCLLFFLFLFMAQVSAQGVGISENNGIPDPNAILDIKSSAKGVLLPRTSAGSRFAIPATQQRGDNIIEAQQNQKQNTRHLVYCLYLSILVVGLGFKN